MKTAELFEVLYNPLRPVMRQVKLVSDTPKKGYEAELDIWTHQPTGKYFKWVMQPMKTPDGQVRMQHVYHDPDFERKSRPTGMIKGAVGEWLKLMGATEADLPKAVDEVRKSPEYQALIKMGFVDKTTDAQKKNGSIDLFAEMPEAFADEENVKERTLRRTIRANGNIKAYGVGNANSDRSYRSRTLHPWTLQTHPDATGLERIVGSMRQSMARIEKVLKPQFIAHFKKSLKRK